MVKITLLSAAAVSALCASTLCLAAAEPDAKPVRHTGEGVYVGVQGGWGNMKEALELEGIRRVSSLVVNIIENYVSSFQAPSTEKDAGFAGRLYLGYLFQHRALRYGAELGAMKYPDTKYEIHVTEWPDSLKESSAEANAKQSGYLLDLLAVGKCYVGDRFHLIGKAGAAYVKQKISSSVKWMNIPWIKDTDDTFSDEPHKIRPEIQIGLGYDLNQNIGLTVSYAQMFGQEESEEHPVTVKSIYVALAGIEFHFA